MPEMDFKAAVREICIKDSRYPIEAYIFVREALDFTTKMLNKPAENKKKHVTGSELLDGIREYAIQEFGPMTSTVFKTWGISRTEDFGEIVFNLVDSGLLGKTDTDKKEDFANCYDFFNTFIKPFMPASAFTELKNRRKATPTKRRRSKQ
ncbi:MAG: hypothetical protein PHR77_14070 [Kiritimatiellae bacterium]|nr:hypothetical protein [Kiritimatiellia bacterium]MDD5520632.1 hypothetical protein [Kiritimatiellia bacterium]